MSFSICIYQMPFCPFPVSFLGASVIPMAFTNFVISASVIFQAFFFIFFAGLGDFGPYRKQILLQTGLGGAILCMANILFVDGDDYVNAGINFVLTNVLFGASIVMYNAYLPFITKSHPTFQEQMTQFKKNKAGGAMKMGQALKELLECYSDLQDAISARGFFYGYFAGFVMVLITMIIMIMEPTMFGIRLSIFLSGLWWFVFSLPMIPYMEKRPGPPLPKAGPFFILTFSFKRLLASMRCLPHIPETFRFTIAYFMFSDAYSTIASVGVIFAIDEMEFRWVIGGARRLKFVCCWSYITANPPSSSLRFFSIVATWKSQPLPLSPPSWLPLELSASGCSRSGEVTITSR